MAGVITVLVSMTEQRGFVIEHEPVLLAEAVRYLVVDANGCYVDATFGRGGHCREILRHLSEQGRVYAMDRDPAAVAMGWRLQQLDQRLTVEQRSFAEIGEWAREKNMLGQVDGILLDIGVSTPQLKDPERGFSFQLDGPLDMRMDPTSGISAAQWIATATESAIASVLKEYGEERFARRIARAIVVAREEAPIDRTGQLAEIVSNAVPMRERHKHPATRTFQAIRLLVNQELEALQSCLHASQEVLAPGGRLVVISFHSLEDRIVKQYMRGSGTADEWPAKFPFANPSKTEVHWKVLGRTKPTDAEIQRNPQARSAVCRAAEKVI